MTENEETLHQLRLEIATFELEKLKAKDSEKSDSSSKWNSPLLLALIGTIGTALVAILNNIWQFNSSREAERIKLESSLILKATESPTAEDRKKALAFLVEAGLISDQNGKLRKLTVDEVPRIIATQSNSSSETNSRRYVSSVPIPKGINNGLNPAPQRRLLELFGPPGKLTRDPSPVTNQKLKPFIITKDVGPFSVTGLAPAVASIERIMARVQVDEPELYSRLGSGGMLLIRSNRGRTSFSNHAFGTAIDITIDGEFDRYGDGKCFVGLSILSRYFFEEGFFWGAGFDKEDSMHFEASKEVLDKWFKAGAFGSMASKWSSSKD